MAKWTDSKTKIAVALGAGGVILSTVAGFFNGAIDLGSAVEAIWKAAVVGYGVVGIRGWFKK